MAALPRTGADEAAVPLTRIFHTCKMTCNVISVKAANKYRKVGHRQRLPVWWYIPMYMGRMRVDIMHFLVESTPCKMLPDVGICCNTLGCMIHVQLMLHCVTFFSCFFTFCTIPISSLFCRKFLSF